MFCRKCNNYFGNTIKINGVMHNIQRRKFCLECSPFKAHNTKPSLSLLEIPLDLNALKICTTCKITKPLSDYYFKRKSNIPFHNCKLCANQESIKRQQQNKVNAVMYKGGKCSICGYNKSMNSLDFHHIDPSKKEFSVSQYKSRSLENIKLELDKCILVCKNCHGEIHEHD